VPLVEDQYSRPTYTADLARALIFLLTDAAGVEGTVHVAKRRPGQLVRRRPACARRQGGCGVRPISLADAGFAGGRPRDSTLNTGRLAGLGLTLPDWTDAVARFCRTIGRTMAATARVA